MRVRRDLLALGALLGAALPAPAENYGRETSPNEIVTTTVDPADDADDFVFDAGTGFKVVASVKRAKTATLAPVLELVAPDGDVTTLGVVAKASKTAAKLTATLAEGGRFALRVRGSSGTGACTLKWKLLPARRVAYRKVLMAGNTDQDFDFQARAGALVSWKLAWKGDGAAQTTDVLGPGDVVVPFDPDDDAHVTRKLTSESVKDIEVPDGLPGGTYRIRVKNDLFSSTVTLSIKVVLPKAAPATVVLTPAEPVIVSIDRLSGTCGAPVVVSGTHLSESPLGLLFAGNAATDIVVDDVDAGVADDGTSASCRAPGGTGTVDLVWVNADGQVAVLPGAFTFDPLPVIDSFDPTQSPGQGGVVLTLYGSGFATDVPDLYSVLVGGVQCSDVVVLDSETITCTVPAHVSGPKSVVLQDKCGESVTAPGSLTYGVGLFITTIRPNAVPVFGGVSVQIGGSNFALTDTVLLDGSPVTTTPVVYSGSVIAHRIDPADLPAHAPGKVDVKVQSSGSASATKYGGLAYFTFAEAPSSSIPAASSTDDWGGVSSALEDLDGNGTVDYIVLTHTAALSPTRPGTRLLKNNGTGTFTDVTSTAMPAADSNDDWAGNVILAGRLNSDIRPDLFLGRPGTGVEWDQDGDGNPDWWEARMRPNSGDKFVEAWSRLLFPDSSGNFQPQTHSGPGGLLAITGFIACNAAWACAGETRPNVCKMFDFDFRCTNAAMGDIDGDSDADIVLVNDRSLADFTGSVQGVWYSCYGNSTPDYQYYTATAYGSAMRILSSGSNGGLTDRTQSLVETAATVEEDFRAVAAFVADADGDFLNDILITHNDTIYSGANRRSASRFFRQKNTGSSVTFKMLPAFFPAPAAASDDDWRGDAVAAVDLNNDFYRDVVVSLNGALPSGGVWSTRILMQAAGSLKVEDKTSLLLAGLLPGGDDARAKAVLAKDIDRDGDVDIVLATPDDLGSGVRRTRLLLNAGRDEGTGLPILIDGSSLFPSAAADTGGAVALAWGDVNGDGLSDLVLTDTHETSGTPARRTRIWLQVR
jgi:hypothetical protein